MASHSIEIQRTDLQNLIEGACFLASGGGGPKDMANVFLEEFRGPVTMVATASMQAGDSSLMVVDLGSPAKAKQGFGLTAPVNAFDCLSAYLKTECGQTPSYLLPGEIGAVNTLLPFYIADHIARHSTQKLLVLDADPCGRADPRLNETLLDVANGISCCPAVIASDTLAGATKTDAALQDKDYHYTEFTDPQLSPTELEDKAREVVSQPGYNQVGGMALYPLEGKFVHRYGRQYLVQESVSLAMSVGKQLRQNPSDAQLSHALDNLAITNYCFVTGTISEDSVRNTDDGFDNGITIINGDDGDTYWVVMRNESLLAWNDTQGRFLAIAPDCINMLLHTDAGRESISNASIAAGQRITLWGTAGPAQVIQQATLVSRFTDDIKHVLDIPEFKAYKERMNFKEYIPIETLNNHD
ncbi:hypothetical protein GCM10011297_27700 [Bacterioplanes sanyensis]|uniref:DUF917 domain-containing protein n=1 Tax=Bacterioplanes sanyensis TaxID=1249553 RepID=UPI0016755446|nr:DUF917 family protein [Bacterioplanes sanyensis]GGY53330.1 hypothetical protein GCM10011297_27700 [Bacterioplanes sanyensis]